MPVNSSGRYTKNLYGNMICNGSGNGNVNSKKADSTSRKNKWRKKIY